MPGLQTESVGLPFSYSCRGLDSLLVLSVGRYELAMKVAVGSVVPFLALFEHTD